MKEIARLARVLMPVALAFISFFRRVHPALVLRARVIVGQLHRVLALELLFLCHLILHWAIDR